MKQTEEKKFTREEKIKIVKELSAEKLLDSYNYYYKNFNPVDDYSIESYEVIKNEILNRMSIK